MPPTIGTAIRLITSGRYPFPHSRSHNGCHFVQSLTYGLTRDEDYSKDMGFINHTPTTQQSRT
jgi:hypothetical protein